VTDRTPKCDRGLLSGGYLKDIPKPHRRKFPEFGPRQVRVHIMKYYGIGVHYYASVEEEDNPIWNPLTYGEKDSYWKDTERGNEVVGWQIAWDDREGRGRRFNSPGTKSPYWIRKWVRETIKKHFRPFDAYEFEDMMGKRMWFYREGD